MKNILKRSVFAFLAMCLAVTVFAQDEISLRIGDPVPEIKYSKWIKGEPVQNFSGDQLYVLEFWATWCGPCKAVMPHLTELQKEYKGKASFIGVNVWESKSEEGKPYDSNLPAIEKFVEGNKANMGYAVMADDNEEHMGNNWMKAAGQNGIPSTFIIKNNQIIWIGHPSKLDSTLPKIIDGSYNMQAYKASFDEKLEKSTAQSAKIKAAIQPVQDALKAKEYQKALDLMEQAKKDAPMLATSLDIMKFNTLLKNVSVEKAIEYGKEWQKDFKNAPVYILDGVTGTDSLDKSVYLWAANNYEKLELESNPIVLHLLASCYGKGADYKNAVKAEEKAVEGAKQALKDGKMVGTIMDYTVKEYEEKLAEYKKLAN